MIVNKNKTYRSEIVKILYFSQSLSSAALSKRLGKSLSLTTNILTELLQEGIVIENGYAASSGGRRAITYSLKANFFYIIAVAMDQFSSRIAILDLHNNIIGEQEELDLLLIKNEEALEVITEKIVEKIAKSGIAHDRFLGIGISMPGFVDIKKGINYTYLPAKGETLAAHIAEKTQLRVSIDNDSSAIALAELKFGAGVNHQNVMVVNIGWGIGLGIIIHKELFRGDSGFAGEFSHIPLFSSNKLCVCGKTGCLETEAALSVIVEKARQGLREGQPTTLRAMLPKEMHIPQDCHLIFQAALKGDVFALDLLSEAGFNIGKGLAVLIHILNPGLIILSGRGAQVGKILEGPVWHALHKYTIPRLANDAAIKISTLGHNADLIGCGVLVMENFETHTVQNTYSTTF